MIITNSKTLASWNIIQGSHEMIVVNDDDSASNDRLDDVKTLPLVMSPPSPTDPSKPLHAMHTNQHIMIFLVNSRRTKVGEVVLEFFEDKIRVHNEKLDTSLVRDMYKKEGLKFLYSKEGLNLRKGYVASAIVISPTIQDLATLGRLATLLQTNTPDPVHCNPHHERGKPTQYRPNYASILADMQETSSDDEDVEDADEDVDFGDGGDVVLTQVAAAV